MTFLIWDIQSNAENSLAAVNYLYGCPMEHENGYRAEQWDNLVSSNDAIQWGFYQPEAKFGREVADLIKILTPGYVKTEDKPSDFFPDKAST